MSQPTAAPPRPSIIVDGVRKRFTINHALSLKDTVVAWIRRRTLTSDFEALKGVDIVVDEGESVAILGLNGSGKSTLLKLISGVMAPDGGQVLTRGRVAGLIEVGAGFHPELSGRENVFLTAAILGMSRSEIEARNDARNRREGLQLPADTLADLERIGTETGLQSRLPM